MRKLISLILLTVATTATQAQKQETPFDQYIAQAKEYFAQGDLQQMASSAHKAIEEAEITTGKQSIEVAQALSLYAEALCYMSEYEHGYYTSLRGCEVVKNINNPEPKLVATLHRILAMCGYHIGDNNLSMQSSSKALEYYRLHPEDETFHYSQCLVYHILACSNIGLHEQVLLFGEELKSLSQQYPDVAESAMVALAQIEVATHLSSDECYDEALEYLTRAEKVIQPDREEYALPYYYILANISKAYAFVGDLDAAYKSSREARLFAQESLGEATEEFIESTYFEALLGFQLGHYQQTVQTITTLLSSDKISLNVTPKHNTMIIRDYDLVATFYNILSSCYRHLGDYAKAVEYSQKCLEHCRKYQIDAHLQSTILNDISGILSDIGEQEKALELLQKALETRDQKDLFYVLILNNIGNIYQKMADFDSAIEYHTQALEVLEQTKQGEPLIYNYTYLSLSTCYRNRQNPDTQKSAEYAAQAFEYIKQEVIAGDIYANTLLFLAEAYSINKEWDKALKIYEQAAANLGEWTLYMQIKYYSGYAFNLFNTRKFKDTITLWKRSNELIKEQVLQQFRWMTSSSRTLFWETWREAICGPTYSYLPTLAAFEQARAIAYNTMLFSKGLLLASNMEFDRVIKQSENPTLIAQFEKLKQVQSQITYYNNQLLNASIDLVDKTHAKVEISRLEKQAQEIEKELLGSVSEYADYTHLLQVEWQDVEQALEENQVAIEFICSEAFGNDSTEPYYAALVLRKGWRAPRYVALGKAKEVEKMLQLQERLYQGVHSTKLYNLIWGALARYIKPGESVYFAPAGALHQINIELLRDEQEQYANQKYKLYRISSTRELCSKSPTSNIAHAALYGDLKYNVDEQNMILASRQSRSDEAHTSRRFMREVTLRAELDELPATEQEVLQIENTLRQYNITTQLYMRANGTEESFKALSGTKTSIIHLATHGFFLPEESPAQINNAPRALMPSLMTNPPDKHSLQRSGLILSGGERAWIGESLPAEVEDGILLAEEIATMDLSATELVVLSACNTGLGEITSEGVFGLQRAFKIAGVQTLIMSLWKVDDNATALFMQTFYSEWFSGASKHEAFAIAQAIMREKYSSPRDWAAFIMLD